MPLPGRLATFALVIASAAVAQPARQITHNSVQSTALPRAAPARGQWPSFRGPGASGVADGQNLPDAWDVKSGENILWRIPIPGLGHSSPIVWGDRIFVTTAVSSRPDATFVSGLYGAGTPSDDRTSQRWMIYCIDRRTGKVIWERLAYEGVPIEKRHMKSTYASATPATDGRIVVAWFGSQGVYAYHLDGTLRWKVDLGHLDVGAYDVPGLEWGTASSPIIWNDLVFLQADTHKDSFVLALDAASGAVRWKAERDELPSWGTPAIVTTSTGTQLVTNGSNFIRAYDPRTGKERWRLGRSSKITVPTPFLADGLIVVASGRGPERPIFVVRPTATGDITPPESQTSNAAVVWSRTGRGPYMPTPIAYNRALYVLANNGIFNAYQLATGDEIYETRLPQLGNGFNSSPVAADGRIYLSGEDGDVTVVAAGPTFRHLATNSIGEPLMATPALSQGAMYLRTSMSLLAVGRAPRPLTDADRARRGLVDDRQKNYSTFAALTESTATRGAGVRFTITGGGPEHAAFAGEWTAEVPGAQDGIVIRLTLEGNRVSGDLVQGTIRVLKVDGTIAGNRIAFSVVFPIGNRTITFTGTLSGDEIAFVRTVKINEGGAPGGAGFFGASGAPSFVARRIAK
ncbi:MAG TPA: PQQ-binding-like beta-propeller repeat protein [Vicinamibacterales bacterium]|nr:PQQ-binding-like beta-propeller repeat protein [Vicinamibacterales bacterium]